MQFIKFNNFLQSLLIVTHRLLSDDSVFANSNKQIFLSETEQCRFLINLGRLHAGQHLRFFCLSAIGFHQNVSAYRRKCRVFWFGSIGVLSGSSVEIAQLHTRRVEAGKLVHNGQAMFEGGTFFTHMQIFGQSQHCLSFIRF